MILYSILILAGLGLFLGLLIAFTAKFFAVAQDPKIEKVLSFLPGANCGGCGFAGCADFAKALVEGQTEINVCPVSSKESKLCVAEYLGLKFSGSEKKVAIVFCGGSNTFAKKAANYNGINDCRSANLVVGGAKACKYGCLGLGTCAKICPVNAIEIIDGLAVVHPELCIACGKCVKACPKNLIKLVPASVSVHVFCSSPEKGVEKKKNCNVPCIACRKCVKLAGENEMLVEGFIVKTNYDKSPAKDLPERSNCPTGCLQNSYPLAFLNLNKPDEVKKIDEKFA